MKDRIAKLTFSIADLRSVPTHHAAFAVAAGFALSEITVGQRLMLLAQNTRKQGTSDDTADIYAYVQVLVVGRSLSAKVIEYLKLVDRYVTACKQKPDEFGTTVSPSLAEVIKGAREEEGYQLAKWLRNKLTNHYDLDEISAVIVQLPDEAEGSLYLHKKDGNSLYVLGEELALVANLNLTGDPASQLDRWQDWLLDACRAMTAVHHYYITNFLERYFPKKTATQRPIELPPKLVGHLTTSTIPVWWDFGTRHLP